MAHQKTTSLTYWKQAENGLIAHVYEHLASSYITQYLTSRGFYYIADFDHWARTYGVILYLDFRVHSKKVSRMVRKAFAEFQKTTLAFEDVLHAAQQIAIEYERPLMLFEETFVDRLRRLHSAGWEDINKLGAFQAESETSVNTVFSTEGIRYGRKRPQSFVETTLHFEVREDVYKNNPVVKALAVLLVQAVALNLHRSLENEYIYYDIGDEWDRGAETVAYRTALLFPKGPSISSELLQAEVGAYFEDMKNDKVLRKFKHLLRSAYRDENARYFSFESMNEITGGVLIGYEGWRSAAHRAVMQAVLDAVTIKTI